jgi:[ribosomal protein S5]-alanine N-acetyltransferase
MSSKPNLHLVPHRPQDLRALLKGTAEYEKSSGKRVADGVREFLLAASPEFLAQLQTASAPDPWKFGFAIVHKIDNGAGGSQATSTGEPARVDEPGGESINVVIGMCGFTGPPDENGSVELAYGIAPSYQSKGYATEAAAALVGFASADPRVRIIRAHTLPEKNASTRVLEKCGFRKTGEIRDPENNVVWQWEKAIEVK